MQVPSPERVIAPPLPPAWWAGGLALTERLPTGHTGPIETTAAARLSRWRDAHGLGASGEFARRLADAGLDDDDLLGLLAESDEALAARTVRPAWAEFTERAIQRPPPSGVAAVDPSLEGFALALRSFTDLAREEVARGAAAAAGVTDLPAVCAQFAAALGERLVMIAARTLVLELNVARVSGRLHGETGVERFAGFVRSLAAGGLAGLFGEYPVLARLLGQECLHAVAAQVELLDRFAADRADIVATLFDGDDPGPVRAVEVGRGDRHGRGRSVAILRFAHDAALVYKPRSQALQHHFGELIEWFNEKIPGLELRVPVILPREGYGWVEFIAPAPCADIGEVDRFYRRQGALLALLYAIDATDIHYENLIAAGGQPVLLDVETLFHPTLEPATTTGPDPAGRALASSVLHTGLLPQLLVGTRGAVDVSGLGGDKGATFPFDAVSWDASGTDEMRLVRRPREFQGAVNRPWLGGRDIDPAEYRSALRIGFCAGYDAIVAHRDELIGPAGPLARCARDEIRVVARATRTYATLLDESTHPDMLRDGLDRDRLLDVLWPGSARNATLYRLIRFEVADLWAGDVPLFSSRPRSRDVWATSGERLPGLLDRAGLDVVTTKIAGMNEVDRLDQEWLITAAMATRSGPVNHRGGEPVPGRVVAVVPDQRRLLAAACGIADQIVARSLQEGQRANWLGLERIDGEHWAVLPLGAGLADGYLGVALFLAQLGHLTGTGRYRDLARKALTPVAPLLDSLAAEPELAGIVGPGGFVGLGGICYALVRLSDLLGEDHDITGWLETAVGLTGSVAPAPAPASIAAGAAGGLLAMLAVHAETGLPAAARVARVLADRLVAAAHLDPTEEPFPPNGFAGGPVGVAYALRRFAATGAGEQYAAAAREISAHATAEWDGTDDVGWCSGTSGLLLAHADLLGGTPDRALSARADRAVAALADRQPLRDSSLCHGELGAVEALAVLAGHGHPRAARSLAQCAARVLGALDRYGPRCGTPDGVPCPGMLTGLAGIGYGLLRLGFADRVPSVLLLEPGSPEFHPNVSARTSY